MQRRKLYNIESKAYFNDVLLAFKESQIQKNDFF